MVSNNQNLANNIKKLREAKWLSQEKLARLADVANNTLIKMESGENQNPTLDTLKKVAKALGVSVDDLIQTAASIVAEIVTIHRFRSKHHFAAYAGVTPIPHSSGKRNRLHTNPFGNRKVNRAIHTIALSQIALKNEQATLYYQKKLKEGKTKLWALRCLKHQIAKRVFQVLKSI